MIKHVGPISGIAAYRDKYVATAGYDNQVILWNQETGRSLTRVVHDHLANQCAFSPDGALLATSSSDYTTRLWTVPELRLRAVLNDQDDDVEMSVFHPSKPLVATPSRARLLRVCGLAGRLARRFVGPTADVISVEWTRHSGGLITSSDDGTVKRWSLDTGELVDDIDLGGAETDSVVISQDGTLYAGNDVGELIVVRDGEQQRLQAHDAGIKRLVLGAERGMLVSLSYDRTLRLWNVANTVPEPLLTADIPADVWPRSCAFAAGSTLVFGTFGATYRTYDYERQAWQQEEVPATFGANAVCVHRGSRYVVGDAGVVWRDGAEHRALGSLCNFLTPLDDVVLTGGQLGQLFDAVSGRLIHQHRSPLNCAARFVRDGVEHAVVGAYTGEGLVIRIGDDGPEHVTDIVLHENAVKGVAVSGDVIFSVCADTSVAFHHAQTLELRDRLPGAHDPIATGCAALGA